MANKRPKPEEIVPKLRQVEVLMGQGMPRLDAIRQIGVTRQTFYRWRKLIEQITRKAEITAEVRAEVRHNASTILPISNLSFSTVQKTF